MPFFNSFKAWILVLGTHGIKGVWFRACSIPLGSSWHLEFPLHNTLCPWPPPALTRTGRSPVSSTRSKPKWCRGAEPEPLTSSWARRARQPEEMCRGCHCGGLASLLLLLVLLLLGQNLGLLIKIPQDALSGTVGQSVLLPVSYRVNSSLLFPLSIVWKFGSSSQVISTCTVWNCSLDAWGTPTNCSAICYPHVTYQGRAAVFPENASLLLWDLQLSDSGVYSVTFQEQNLSRQITLAVHKQHGSTEHPDEGQNLGLLIEIPQDAVSGTVGQSMLLPVSYRINSSLLFPLSILWKFGSSSQVIVTCTAQNCSLDAWGTPTNCSAICYPHVTYQGRAAVFPENASLLLRDLQLNDSGVYSVTFQEQNLSRQITLAVHKQHGSTEHPDKGRCPCAWTDSFCTSLDMGTSGMRWNLVPLSIAMNSCSKGSEVEATPNYYTIGVCSLTGLLLLFLVLCTWWRGMVWKKMRTITQQQVQENLLKAPWASNTADIHMENTVVGDMTTVYATIREDFEETKPRALPETLYTSISFPQYYSALALNSAGDRSAAEPR
ncbi:uncharacterized protein LOC771657 isoform X1 [Gallus gallus]|uniref:uncharacterized protein LOC771657 isoform X1 n=1 Tax=Gallus gallus TaxID=9031 RepID=UPI001AEB1CA5|nr:uncharacterized protein LOC771657 isoform X1 [Gallus gallus]XP_040555178.1 uncharacterized protein LOC771657 isoform X1 [Gallus gallus]